jgi:endoglucanase
VNPLGMVMLTNMVAYGAEKSVNEIYHGWFGDGTDFDNALSSPYGPAPGYVTGGPNPTYEPDASYPTDIVPPQNQPAQKSYKDWNTSWPENSWEITEPAIYYQAAYIKLLSKFVSSAPVSPVRELSTDKGSIPVVYPNPAKDYVTITLNNQSVQSVTIWSVNGLQIYKVRPETSEGLLVISTASLDGGMYVVKMMAEEDVFHVKILVKR